MIIDKSTSPPMKNLIEKYDLEGTIEHKGTTGTFDWFLDRLNMGEINSWTVAAGTHLWITFIDADGSSGKIGLDR